MMETLEGRRLLAFDQGGSASDESEGGQFSTLNVVETVAVPATMTTLVLPSGPVEEGEPVTLEAVVEEESGEAVTGRVAFLLRDGYTGYEAHAYANFPSVGVWLPGVPQMPQFAFLMGTAEVGADGRARLAIDSLPVVSAMLPAHRIVAVYLGKDQLVVPTPGASWWTPLVVTETPQALPSGGGVLDTGGKAFRIQSGQVQLLGETPAGAHVIGNSGLKVAYTVTSSGATISGMTWGGSSGPAVDFAPVDQPVRYTKGSGSDFELIPVGVPASVRTGTAAWGSSVSDVGRLEVKATTSVALRVHGQTTLTNPPAFTATILRPDGTL